MAPSGRHILITGGTRGIGRAIALSQAAPGTTLYVNYLRDEESAAATAEELEKKGAEVHLYPANVAEPDEIEKLIADVRKKTSKLDGLVHNAALGVFKPVSKLRAKDWDISMNVNARALVLLVQAALPLLKGGGRVVTLSSLGSHRYTPDYGAIGISKSAVENAVRYLAVELAAEGIHVNAVSGGLVTTDSLKMFPRFDEMKREFLAKTPGGRLGAPEDLAKVVDFLLSPASDWIYGQTIVADGGYSLI